MRNERVTRAMILVLLVLTSLAPLGCSSHTPEAGLLGAYRFADGTLVSIRRSGDDGLRYRIFQTGESRRLFHDEGHAYVAGPDFSGKTPPIELTVDFTVGEAGQATAMRWRRLDEAAVSATRVNRDAWLTFESEGITLRGRLTLPDSGAAHPAVVLVHGSGDSKATDTFYNGDFLAANGIATFTFDKRGTGSSDGEYTFDFRQLARDVAAAVETLAARDDIDAERIGLIGYSQGAWVAPLAASLDSRIRFVVPSYGLIGSPAEEARVETRIAMRARGIQDAHLDQIDELTNVSVGIVHSNFEEGWDRLAELKRRHKDAPWRKKIYGTTIEAFMNYPKWLIKLIGPGRSPKQLDWYYDSRPVLEQLDVPMAWMIGDRDQSAPTELVLPSLDSLVTAGKPYEVKVFAGADHTMLLFDQIGDNRRYTGYAPDYFTSEVEAVKRLGGGTVPLAAAP